MSQMVKNPSQDLLNKINGKNVPTERGSVYDRLNREQDKFRSSRQLEALDH